MTAARNHEIDCVLVWKFDRFARSTRHLLAVLEEFDHLGVRFISVQDQVDTESPMGRAMFTIIGAMAELESSLISERVTAGMRAAEARGKHLGRPSTPQHVVSEVVALATSTGLSIRQIQARIAGRASRSMDPFQGSETHRVDRRLGDDEPGDDAVAAGQTEQGLGAVGAETPIVWPAHFDPGQPPVIRPVREPGAAIRAFSHRIVVGGDGARSGW